jgi:hypothetical protein
MSLPKTGADQHASKQLRDVCRSLYSQALPFLLLLPTLPAPHTHSRMASGNWFWKGCSLYLSRRKVPTLNKCWGNGRRCETA